MVMPSPSQLEVATGAELGDPQKEDPGTCHDEKE
jgi:hypothetical protein